MGGWDEQEDGQPVVGAPNLRSLVPLFLIASLIVGFFAWLSLRPGVETALRADSALTTPEDPDGSSAAVGADDGEPDGATGIAAGEEPPAGDDGAAGDDGVGGDPAGGGAAGVTGDDPSTTSTAPGSTTVPPVTVAEGPGVIYYNDFAAGAIGPEWEQYDGVGNAGWGYRRPSALSVVADPDAAGGRCLAITASMGEGADAGRLVSGGMKLLGHSLVYGRYTVRVRVEDDPAQVTNGVVLLWPSSDRWPEEGEINIVESYYHRDTRTPVESRLHWMVPDAVPPFDRSDDALNQVDHLVDGSDWHTYVLEWTADAVTVSVDDGPPRTLSGGDAVIPSTPMDLTLQLDGFDVPDTGIQPSLDRPVTMCVDFVQVEQF